MAPSFTTSTSTQSGIWGGTEPSRLQLLKESAGESCSTTKAIGKQGGTAKKKATTELETRRESILKTECVFGHCLPRPPPSWTDSWFKRSLLIEKGDLIMTVPLQILSWISLLLLISSVVWRAILIDSMAYLVRSLDIIFLSVAAKFSSPEAMQPQYEFPRSFIIFFKGIDLFLFDEAVGGSRKLRGHLHLISWANGSALLPGEIVIETPAYNGTRILYWKWTENNVKVYHTRRREQEKMELIYTWIRNAAVIKKRVFF